MRVIVIIAAATMGAALASCDTHRGPRPDNGPECEIDDDCAENATRTHCLQGTCAECIDNTDCDCHHICQEAVCELLGAADQAHAKNAHGVWSGTPGEPGYTPGDVCADDGDCRTGEVCNLLTGGCLDAVDYADSCRTARCPPGLVCEPNSKRCFPPALCQGDHNCACTDIDGFVCDGILCLQTAGECTPPGEDQVVSGCIEGKSSEECSAGLFCSRRGLCVQCTCDADCIDMGGLTRCWLGTGKCVPPDYCMSVDDCQAGESCDTRDKNCEPRCDDTDSNPDNDCALDEYCEPDDHVCRPIADLPCIPDNFEPNQSAEQAVGNAAALPLPAIGGNLDVTQLTLCENPTDRSDWYTLALSAGDRITIRGTSNTMLTAGLSAYMPDAITELDSGSIGAAADMLDFTANYDDVYFVAVEADSNSSGTYELNIERAVGQVCTDAFEQANGANNTAATATLLNGALAGAPEGCSVTSGALGAAHTLSCTDTMRMCEGDADYYAIEAPAGADVTVTINNFTIDLELYLYGPFYDGEVLSVDRYLDASTTTGTAETVEGFSRPAATYLVRVLRWVYEGQVPSAYNLSVTVGSGGSACVEDVYDAETGALAGAAPLPQHVADDGGLNDLFAHASVVDVTPVGPSTVVQVKSDLGSGLTLCRGDVEWFELGVGAALDDLPAGRRIKARLTEVTKATSDKITIAAGTSATALPYGSTSASSPASELFIPNTNGGPYYVKVLGGSANTGTVTYTLELEYIQPPTCDADGLGDIDAGARNDTPTTALALAAANGWPTAVGDAHEVSGISLCGGDDDWYRIQTPAGGASVVVTVRHEAEEGDVGLALFDSTVSGATVTPSEPPATGRLDTSTLDGYGFQRVRATVSGEAYVMVYNRTGWPLMDYSLEVRFVESACFEDGREEDDTWETAKPFPLSVAAPGTPLQTGLLPVCTMCTDAYNEADWSWVVLGPGDSVTTTVFFDPAEGALALRLYEPGPDGVNYSVASDFDWYDRGILSLTHGVTASDPAGKYLIKVAPYSYGGVYNWDNLYATQVDVRRACVADEDEPSSVSSPAPVAPGYAKTLSLCREEDWYEYTCAEAAAVELAVCVDFTQADGDIDVIVFDSSRVHPVGGSLSANTPERATFTATPGQTYYVKVYMETLGNTTYTMSMGEAATLTCP